MRSKAKGEYLVKLFSGKGHFDYVLVDDITKVSYRRPKRFSA